MEHRLIDKAAPTCAGLLLASASERRRELLRRAGVEFQTEIAQVQELTGAGMPARNLCLLNAQLKATEVAARFPDRIVLGADTIVSFDGRIFGKPRDAADARAMLEELCGRVHEVLTGVCLVHRSQGKLCRFTDSTRVKFRARREVDLDAYLRSIYPLDKAGAYAAQEEPWTPDRVRRRLDEQRDRPAGRAGRHGFARTFRRRNLSGMPCGSVKETAEMHAFTNFPDNLSPATSTAPRAQTPDLRSG